MEQPPIAEPRRQLRSLRRCDSRWQRQLFMLMVTLAGCDLVRQCQATAIVELKAHL